MPYCLHLKRLSTLLGLIWRRKWHLRSNGKGVTSQKTGMIAVVAVRISKDRLLWASFSYTYYLWRAAMSARIKMSFRHVYRLDVRPRCIGPRRARTQALILSSGPELLGVPQNIRFWFVPELTACYWVVGESCDITTVHVVSQLPAGRAKWRSTGKKIRGVRL